jgi:hypothetical protein
MGTDEFPPNQALAAFEPFIGTWHTVGSHPEIETTLHGETSFAWHESGAFIIMRSSIVEDLGVPRGVAIIGSDDKLGTYSMIYYDSRGVSRTMKVSIAANVLVWWRSSPEMSQRYTLTVSGDMIVSKGEASTDSGATWRRDLDQTFTRTS